MVGTGEAFADYAQGPDLPSHWGHRGRAHHVLARAAWRQAQLGLPLLLAARCHHDPIGFHEPGLLRGSPRLARLAGAINRRQSGADADHVWLGRRAPSARIRTALADWL